MKRILSILLSLAVTLPSLGLSQAWAGPNVDAGVAADAAAGNTGLGGISGAALPGAANSIGNAAALPAGVSNVEVNLPGSIPGAPARSGAASLNSNADAEQTAAVSSLSSEASAASPETISSGANPAAVTLVSKGAAPQTQSSASGISGAIARLRKAFSNPSEETGPSAYANGIIRIPQGALVVRKNVTIDSKPRAQNEDAVLTNRFHLSKDHVLADGSAPAVLNADNNEASIEAALMKLVDSDPAKYGASSADMAKVNVSSIKGSQPGQADSYIAVFRQWKEGKDNDGTSYNLMVSGGQLTFHVKVLDGKPVVMGTSGRLYPGISPDIMTPGFNDNQLQGFAENKLLGTPPSVGPLGLFAARSMAMAERALGMTQEKAPQLITRQIAKVGGQFRAVNLYDSTDLKGQSMVVAVDIKTGEAFAWDDRSMIQTGPPAAAAISGVVNGRGNTVVATDGSDDHGPVGPLPLAYVKVLDDKGSVVATTDANGNFSIPNPGDTDPAPMKLTVKLDGKYGVVNDDDSKDVPMVATIVAAPGQSVTLTVNPDSSDEQLVANINTYTSVTTQIAYLQDTAGVTDARIQAPLSGGMNTNKTDMPANAYYDPSNDSINLEKRATINETAKADGADATPAPGPSLRETPTSKKSAQVYENTATRSIIFHEITHRAVQMMSQVYLTAAQTGSKAMRFVERTMDAIMDGGLNEGIADAVSESIRDNPVVGAGFFLTPQPGQPNYIRNAAQVTKYDPSETEPHAASEPFSQSIWEIREGLKARMGTAAGADYAAKLMLRTTLYSQPQDMTSALMHFLLADMKADGTIPNEDLIRGAADKRAIPMQASPKPPAANTPPAA